MTEMTQTNREVEFKRMFIDRMVRKHHLEGINVTEEEKLIDAKKSMLSASQRKAVKIVSGIMKHDLKKKDGETNAG